MSQKGKRPVVLCILDGWGHRDAVEGNAIARARTPVFDRLWANEPHALLRTSAADVGLPEGQMGNSEVGHQSLGAGRVVLQDLPRIDRALADGSLSTRPALLEFIASLEKSGGVCHLLGLLSPGGVHAHTRHILGLARIVAARGIKVCLHGFLDGRDVPPRSAADHVSEIAAAIATQAGMADGDGLLMANFRADRVRQLLSALLDPGFDGFKRGKLVHFAGGATLRNGRLADVAPTLLEILRLEQPPEMTGVSLLNAAHAAAKRTAALKDGEPRVSA